MKKITLYFLLLVTYAAKAQHITWLAHINKEPDDECLFAGRDTKGNTYVYSSHSGGNSAGSAYGYNVLTKYDKWKSHRWESKIYQWGLNLVGMTMAADRPVVFGNFWAPSSLLQYQSANHQGCVIARVNAQGGADGGAYIYPYSNSLGVIGSGNELYYFGQYQGVVVVNNDTILDDSTKGSIIMKLDTAFKAVWYRKFPHTTYNFYPLLAAREGQLYITCNYVDSVRIGSFFITPDSGRNGLFSLALDSIGDILWLRNTCPAGRSPSVTGVTVDQWKNFYATVGENYYDNYWMIKYDSSGKILWKHALDHPIYSLDNNDQIIVSLVENENQFVRFYDTAGVPINEFHERNTFGRAAYATGNNHYLVCGYFGDSCSLLTLAPSPAGCSGGTCNYLDAFILEFSDTTGNTSIKSNTLYEAIEIKPNPSRVFKISLGWRALSASCEIINSQGVKIKEKMIDREEMELDLTEVPAGIYLVRISGRDQVLCKKIVVD